MPSQRHALLELVFGALSELVALVGQDGRVIVANRAYVEAFGDASRPAVPRGAVGAALSTGGTVRRTEARLRADGVTREYEVTALPIADGGRATEVVEVSRDVTEERDLARQLQHAQKMEAIGTLAGAIAHDFNNILFGILGYAELVRMDVPADSLAAKNLGELIRGAQRARRVVDRLQAFSRNAEARLAPVDLANLADEVARMVRVGLPAGVRLVTNLASAEIVADPGQIAQVCTNLCANAIQAMPDGGTLEITVHTIDVDDEFAARHVGFRPGGYAVLGVSDTGMGIPAEYLDRVFEPFFTTKEFGAGTGLGLSVAHGIVRSHGGVTTVYSQPGQGTTFKVYLPLLARTGGAGADPDGLRGTERILVVDDEPAIAEMCRQILTRLGYQVATRSSAEDALTALREADGGFDLVVTDLVMPGLNGHALACAVHEISPKLPVLLMTGFGLSMTEQQVVGAGIRAVVGKPVVAGELTRQIRAVFDTR